MPRALSRHDRRLEHDRASNPSCAPVSRVSGALHRPPYLFAATIPPSGSEPLTDSTLQQLSLALRDSHTIERELGGGGMSRVFLARETALDRLVVIKVLPADLMGGVSVERFRREIQIAGRLQ